MPFSEYKDLSKSPSDLIGDDFDTKYSLKIKSKGPENTTITTTTSLSDKTLTPKLALKWGGVGGFALDKLEFTNKCALAVETSILGLADGLKLSFKGNDKDKADMSLVYKHDKATVNADMDILNMKKVSASLLTGFGSDIKGGVKADVAFDKDKAAVSSTKVDFGLSYTVPSLFVSGHVNNNLSEYSGFFEYDASAKVKVAGKVNYSDKTDATLVTQYLCNPKTTLKVKVNTAGTIAASCKQDLPMKLSVTGVAEVPANFSNPKFGIGATLG